jgi:hypothetical protein
MTGIHFITVLEISFVTTGTVCLSLRQTDSTKKHSAEFIIIIIIIIIIIYCNLVATRWQ